MMRVGMGAAMRTAALAIYGATLIASARASQGAVKTTWDSVYSDARRRNAAMQSTRSIARSATPPDLTGADVAPALTGADFAANWNDLTLGNLFERMRIGMPADKPGSVSRQDNADVLAFMLFKAGFPAGTAELPTQTELLKDFTFVAQKK